MQIDFHHSVVYVLSRLAGFTADEAGVISHSSQYVDDEINEEVLRFDNGAIYKTICSAHKKVDYANLEELKNHMVWVPFHFLPGNQPGPTGDNLHERLVCRQDSEPAKEMVRECIRQREKPNGLHRLGITLHVYADTWAHKGFSGVESPLNRVDYFRDDDDAVSRNLLVKMENFFKDKFAKELGRIIDTVMPLGHGPVLSYPDLPYLKWKYIRHDGAPVHRDNTADFTDACVNLFKALSAFRAGREDFEKQKGPEEKDLALITGFLGGFTDPGEKTRHRKWLDRINEGAFSFGSDDVRYADYGKGSWLHDAMGVEALEKHHRHGFSGRFVNSDFKKFHDALEDHRYYLLRRLFPQFDLCVA